MDCVYYVNAQSLSLSEFEQLYQDLNGATFLVSIIVDTPQTLQVITNTTKELESLKAAYPNLKKCRISQSL